MTLTRPTQITEDIFSAGIALFRRFWRWEQPIRSVGLRCTNLIDIKHNVQLSFLNEDEHDLRGLRLEQTIDDIRRRFGASSILRCGVMLKPELTGYSYKEDRRLAVYRPAGIL